MGPNHVSNWSNISIDKSHSIIANHCQCRANELNFTTKMNTYTTSSPSYASYSICFRALTPGLIFQSRVHNQLVVFGFARHSAYAPAELGSSPIRVGDVLSGVNDISLLDGDGMKVEDQLAILSAAEAFSTRDTCLHFLRPLPSSIALPKADSSSDALFNSSSAALFLPPSSIHDERATRMTKKESNRAPSTIDSEMLDVDPPAQDGTEVARNDIICNHDDAGAVAMERYEVTELVSSSSRAAESSTRSSSSLLSRLQWVSPDDQNKMRFLAKKALTDSQIKKGVLASMFLNSYASNLSSWMQGKVSLQPNSTMVSLLFRWLARGCPTSCDGFQSPTSTLPDQEDFVELRDQQVIGVGLPTEVWSWVTGGRSALETAWLRDELKMEKNISQPVPQIQQSVPVQFPNVQISSEMRRPQKINISCWLGLWESSRVNPDRGDGKRDGPICVRRVLGPRGDIRAIEAFLSVQNSEETAVNDAIAHRSRIRLMPASQHPPVLGGLRVTAFRADQKESHVLGHHKADGVMRIGRRYQAELPKLQATVEPKAEPKDKLLWSAAAFRQKNIDTMGDNSKGGIARSDTVMGDAGSSLPSSSSVSGVAKVDGGQDVAGADGAAARVRGRANRRSAGPPPATQDQESGLVSSSSLVSAASTPLPGATRFQTFFSLGRLPIPVIEYGDDVFSLTLLQVCGFSFLRASDLLNTILNTLNAEAARLNDVDTNHCKRKPVNARTQIVTEALIAKSVHQKKRGRGADVVNAQLITFPEIPPPHPLLAEHATPVVATLDGVQKTFLLTPGLRFYPRSETVKLQADLLSHFDLSNSSEPFDESVVQDRLQYSMLPDSAKPCPKNPMSALAWATCVCMLDFKLTPIQIAQRCQFLKTQVLKKFLGGTSNLGPSSLAQLLNWMKVNIHATVRTEVVSALKSFSTADIEADFNFTKAFAAAIEASSVFFPTEEFEHEIEDTNQETTMSPTLPPVLIDGLREAFVGACGRFSWNNLDRCLFELNAELNGKRIAKVTQGIADMKRSIFEIASKVVSSSADEFPIEISSAIDGADISQDAPLTILSACQTAMAASNFPSVSECVSYFYKPWPGQGNTVQLEFQHWRKRLNYNPLAKTRSAKFLLPSDISLPELIERASVGDTVYFSYSTQMTHPNGGGTSKKKMSANEDSSESDAASGSGSNPSLQKLAARINAEYTPLIMRLEAMIKKGNDEAGEDSDDEDDEIHKTMTNSIEPDGEEAEEAALPAETTTTQTPGEMKPIGNDIEINIEERFFGVHTEECAVCEYGGNIVSCASCERQYHFPCIGRTTPLTFPPEGLGLWTCPVCEQRYASDDSGLQAARTRIQLELEVDLARKRFAFCRRRVARADDVRRAIDKIIVRFPHFPAAAVKKLVYEWACIRDPEEMSLNTRVGCPLLFSSALGINLHNRI